MKRGGLFLVAIISAVITIVSLNAAFGRPGYFNERYGRYGWHHRCYDRYYDDEHYYHERKNPEEKNQPKDSATGNY